MAVALVHQMQVLVRLSQVGRSPEQLISQAHNALPAQLNGQPQLHLQAQQITLHTMSTCDGKVLGRHSGVVM